MRDSDIVALLVADDQGTVRRGLEAAYSAYADRIHDYAHGMLRAADPAAAADVTHDTFLIAQAKAPGLRDPERLRPWLYAIARNECLRVLRQTKRRDPLEYDDGSTHPALAAAEAEGSPDMSSDLDRADLRTLVTAAAAGLSPKDREVFDLGLRHDLRAPEVAAALGVTDNAAHAMLSRVRGQFERALGALSVARHGRQSCGELDQLLTGWDGEFDALWRKRIARHVDSCATCSAVQKREVSPAALLSVLPLVAAPVLVRDRLFSDDLDLVSASRPLAQRAGPFDRDGGFPGAMGSRRRRGALVLLGVLLLIGSVGTISWLALARTPDQEVVSRQALPDQTSTEPSYEVLTNHTLSPTDSALVSPTASESPTTTPTDGETPSMPDDPTPGTPTSADPTPDRPTPTREPTRNPTTAPPTSDPPTTPPDDPVGTLRLDRTSVAIAPGSNGRVQLTAVGGPVEKWTATSSSNYVTVSPASGSLAEDETVLVVLSVSGRTPRTEYPMTITFNPGGLTLTITLPQ
ncbi:sigma-70 family RNA polymerase sigma factor [Nocardioides speluncae]|uniref:sigma-70 family RNA polymerase sigma factor n=1 Tax=Nocardioides speluncae TaxID=2670337 RepID=UPI000D69FB3E|nr:sigma-70 family RNA polymerase sigma factor [Nocardioides speluncae]